MQGCLHRVIRDLYKAEIPAECIGEGMQAISKVVNRLRTAFDKLMQVEKPT